MESQTNFDIDLEQRIAGENLVIDIDGFETTSVSLNGGTIKDSAGNNALLTSAFSRGGITCFT